MRKLIAIMSLVVLAALFVHALGGWMERKRVEVGRGSCSTDTECMERFGGDGGPY